MNLTVGEAISQIKIPTKAVNSDAKLTNKYLYSLLRKHRDILIRQLDSKLKLMKLNYLFQVWNCVTLIQVNSVDESCGLNVDCKITRTRAKLPTILVGSNGPIIKNVYSVDTRTRLIEINPEEWIRKLDNPDMLKYDRSQYYYYNEGYLWFPNLKWKKIKIQAYFEENIDKFNDCDGENIVCKSILDDEFRIPRDLLAICIQNANKELFDFYERVPEDEQPDKNTTRKS